MNEPAEGTTVRRFPEMARYDRETIYAILDEALLCHIGFVDGADPVVIPTIHVRSGDNLYVHGAPASRMMKRLSEGVPVCVTATLIDGIVLARAPVHSAYNYRSVVLFGNGVRVRDYDEKLEALRLITEHVTPNRWEDGRTTSKTEVDQTAVVRIPINEASAKVASGPPEDEPEDYDLDIWAGIIPIKLTTGEPIPDPSLRPGIEVPDYLIRPRI